jgi:hypothetical protein
LEQVRKKAAEEYDAEDCYCAIGKQDCAEHVEWKTESFIKTIKRGLEEIADCRNDVDEYINACSFITPIHEHDHLGIAKRLLDHSRYEEALKWLDEMSKPIPHAWEGDYFRIKIDTLFLSEDKDAAQRERIHWFSFTIYTKKLSLMQILMNLNESLEAKLSKKHLNIKISMLGWNFF